MDDTSQNTRDDIKDVNDTATELAHITQEMYKKNFELAEKNKILSLLRKIDEIVLSTVKDTHQIAQKVVDIVAEEAGFKAVAIYLIEQENLLSKIAFSKTELILKFIQKLNVEPFPTVIELKDDKNIIVNCLNWQGFQIIEDFRLILYPSTSNDVLSRIDELNEIKSAIIYPLKSRNELLGVLIFCDSENVDSITQFQKDLIERLGDVIGIAIDNALLYKELKDANESLKQLDHLKDDFVSVASHELRTPMTAIKSYLWMALTGQGGSLNEKQFKYVQRAYYSTDRLIKLVNDMLNISRIDSGRLTVQLGSVNIVRLAHDVVDELNPRSSELGVEVLVEPKNDISNVMADPDKIKEVLYNLIGNSMKFTAKGGKITITIMQKDNMVELAVGDTGAGIEASDIPKLFQKFNILPGTYVTNQATFGTGLGLYICKSLIDLHGGKIWVLSEGKGKGTTFSFTLRVFNKDDLSKFQEKYKQSTNQ